MKKNPKVSIIIPTFNRPTSLIKTLDSLETQTYKNFEVVVVEGGSFEKTKKFLSTYRGSFEIKLFPQKGKGLPNAVNLGIKNSKGEIVIRTDDDIVASPEWLRSVVDTFKISEEIAGVSGPTIIPTKRLKNRGIFLFLMKFIKSKNPLWRLLGKIYIDVVLEGKPYAVGRIFKSGAFSPGSNFPSALRLKKPIEVDYLEACNMCLRKDIVNQVRGFDEKYAGIGDWSEPDLCFRIKKRGYKLLFNPRVKIQHILSTEGVFSARARTYDRSKNFIRFYFKHIKPNSIEKIFKLSVNLLFINGFWTYGFLRTGNTGYLTGILGTVVGLIQYGLGLNDSGGI